MKFLKKYLKFLIGVAVLVLVIIVFFFAMRSTGTSNLETGNLKQWVNATADRRIAAVQIASASDTDSKLIMACVDKIASMPGSEEMMLRDAISLCRTGILLKENL